jgi:hypothetical protein
VPGLNRRIFCNENNNVPICTDKKGSNFCQSDIQDQLNLVVKSGTQSAAKILVSTPHNTLLIMGGFEDPIIRTRVMRKTKFDQGGFYLATLYVAHISHHICWYAPVPWDQVLQLLIMSGCVDNKHSQIIQFFPFYSTVDSEFCHEGFTIIFEGYAWDNFRGEFTLF